MSQTNSTALAAPGGNPLQLMLGDPAKEWQRPAVVPANIAAAATAALAKWPARYVKADHTAMKGWLVKLGIACAGSMTPADAEAKVKTLMVIIDDFPACCFTDASLKRIAPTFNWFPGIKELTDALNGELHRQRTLEARLRALLKPAPKIEPPRPGKKWADMTPEERANAEATLKDGLAHLAAAHEPKAARVESERSRDVRAATQRVTAAISAKRPPADDHDGEAHADQA